MNEKYVGVFMGQHLGENVSWTEIFCDIWLKYSFGCVCVNIEYHLLYD
jgi:hypothetical protein